MPLKACDKLDTVGFPSLAHSLNELYVLLSSNLIICFLLIAGNPLGLPVLITLSLLRHYILENYNLNLQSDEALKEQIIELKEKLNKNQFNYGILKKINNLLIESKGTQKEEFLVARLNSFYDVNSKVQIH